MTLQIGATIVGLLSTITASLWGLNGLRQDYGLALEGYNVLWQLFIVGSHLATAETLITSAHPDRAAALGEVERAASKFQLATAAVAPAADGAAGPEPAAVRPRGSAGERPGLAGRCGGRRGGGHRRRAARRRRSARERAGGGRGRAGARRPGREPGPGPGRGVAAQIRRHIQQSQVARRRSGGETVVAIGVVSAAAVVWAILLGVWQYRGVVTPLNRLSAGVRRMAAGEFTGARGRTRGRGVHVAGADFNRMAERAGRGSTTSSSRRSRSKSKELVAVGAAGERRVPGGGRRARDQQPAGHHRRLRRAGVLSSWSSGRRLGIGDAAATELRQSRCR